MRAPDRLDGYSPAAVFACICLGWIPNHAAAQAEDLSFPPRIDGTPLEANYEPAAEAERPMEEVVVIYENRWRLPDLGSTWRLRQNQEEESARIEASFLPLYDPEETIFPPSDSWAVHREIRRVGFIEIFRIRFGER